MPAVLTHKTIMLLARERLAGIRDTLRAKLLGAGVKTDLEHRVLYLAEKAHAMMTDFTLSRRGVLFPLGAEYLTPLGQDVSPYAVMGSMGPDITAFSALFARGQSWVFDTVHKGNPDENREPIVSRSSDFVLNFWKQVTDAQAAGRASADDVRAMRAYLMGHLCHIAGDVISHPYINDLEWHLGSKSRAKFSHAGGEGTIDAKVAQQILLRRSTREGQDWDKWWPTHNEVPEVFWAAYTEALDSVYQARSEANRPKGFGAFEERFVERKAPALTLDFVKDGYHLYRSGILGMGYGWGYGHWFGFLTPMMLPLSLTIALSGALPHSREFFTKRFQDVGERGWFELLTLPLALGSVIPVFYGIWIATLSTRGVEGLSISGIIFGIVSFILGLAFLTTVGKTEAEFPAWARWLFLFAPMLIIPLIYFAIGLADFKRDDGTRRGALGLIFGMAFPLWVIFMLGFLIIAMGFGILAQKLADAITGTPGTAGDVLGVIFYVLGMLVLTVLLIVGWVMLPKTMRDAKIPELPVPFPADRPHFVRVFDDSTLFHDPALATPDARQLFYPAARRALLKLWWEGPGELHVRSEQSRLAFSFTGSGEPTKVVESPMVPMTAQEYGAYLTEVVTGPGGELRQLKTAPVYPADFAAATLKEYHLPPGATFSEEASDHEEEEGLPAAVAAYKKLGTTEANTEYVLRHADKPLQSIRFGARGPIESTNPEDDVVGGPGKVTSSGTTVTGTDSAFQFFFDPGDQLGVGTQVRVVTRIVSNTELEINAPFKPEIGSAADYVRVGAHLERLEGFNYVSTPAQAPGAVGGGAVMDLAADVGALLCMGMAGQMLPTGERNVPSLAGQTAFTGGAAIDASVGKVYQVFRNWSLDRRRQNEWRMLIAGGARSEKNAPNQYDAAMPLPQPPVADWNPANVVAAGEPVANAQGWVPVLRQWLTRVSAGSAIDPAVPANSVSSFALSQAMAFLLDLRAPTRLA